MGVDLALQGVEPSLKQQAFLLFERHLDAQCVPYLERDAHEMGAHSHTSACSHRLPEQAARRGGAGNRCAIQSRHISISRDEKQQQNLAIDARLVQVAAHPALEAQIDEGRKGPDLFFFDKAAEHARSQAKRRH